MLAGTHVSNTTALAERPGGIFHLLYCLSLLVVQVLLVLDFTKITLELDRCSCFIIVEISVDHSNLDDPMVKYTYHDYLSQNSIENSIYVGTAMQVCTQYYSSK